MLVTEFLGFWLVGVDPIPMQFVLQNGMSVTRILTAIPAIAAYLALPFFGIGYDKLKMNREEDISIFFLSVVIFIWSLFMHSYLISSLGY